MQNVSLIIPAYKPDEKLIDTLRKAVDAGFNDILVIDDGSGKEFSDIFERVEGINECTLLRHSVNRGKGAAMKTAMSYFLENRPEHAGVVTADADGQHLTKDILACAETMVKTNHITLGCRDFTQPQVPFKSRNGNRITIAVFRLFFGMKISDTQTGLRAFPRDTLKDMISISGDRYEYETHMLFQMSRDKTPFEEVKIDTVYIDDNRSSHFRAFHDSVRIYSILLKYLFSSIAGTAVDALVFFLLKLFPFLGFLPIPLTFSAAIIARAVSSFVNFLINAKVVFGDKVCGKTTARYYILVLIQICVSALTVFIIEHILHIESAFLSTMIKLIVDTILFFFSFRIQHKWVFNK